MLKIKDLVKLIIIGVLGALLYSGCTEDKGKNIPDVSHIDVDLNIKHFENDVFTLDTNQITPSLEKLDEQYPIFLKEVFLGRILPVLQDTSNLKLFLGSPGIIKLRDTVNTVFGDFEMEKDQLENMFRFYNYHFPERKIPEIITFISEYTLGSFTYEDEILGIGLDFYLGADYPNYNPNYFPKYIKRTMTRNHLLTKTAETLANDIVGQPAGDRMLDIMVNNGKVLYVMDALLPRVADSLKLAYTQEQVNWCKENETQMWAYFLGEDLLYSTNRNDIRKLVDHSPHSPGMPDDAPGRTGNYVGWQIVKNYMKRNPDKSINDLINMTDAQLILEQAKYRPRN